MPNTPESSLLAIAVAGALLKSPDVLNARARAGFALANGARRAQSRSMSFIEADRKHAGEQGVSQDEALKKSTEAKPTEFVERGPELYANAWRHP
jgi:hypothetical protein